MTDYVKVFDGAGHDVDETIVSGQEWDVEYDSIQVALDTKADAPIPATLGDLIEQDGNGNSDPTGIASANLDGLTSNIQTNLDLTANRSTEETGYLRGGNTQIWSGAGNKDSFTPLWSIATDSTLTTYSVGPTGSGKDKIWSALDDIPSSGRCAIISVRFFWQTQTGGSPVGSGMIFQCRESGTISGINIFHEAARCQRDHPDGQNPSFQTVTCTNIMVPLDTDQTFTFKTSTTGDTGASGYLMIPWLQGFLTE